MVKTGENQVAGANVQNNVVTGLSGLIWNVSKLQGQSFYNLFENR